MRLSEGLKLVIAILVPGLLVTVGWPRFAEWLAAPAAPSTPETAGAAATPLARADAWANHAALAELQ